MTATDVRAFYGALGVELPAWSQREAGVRCFAQPAAHHNCDRSPSCSVNLTSGVWNCHGCGAAGGPYDAALAVGCTPRLAIDLMVVHGLTERRIDSARRTPRVAISDGGGSRHAGPGAPHAPLGVDDADVRRWSDELQADGRLLWRLLRERAWSGRVIHQLVIGSDGARITIPIRSSTGALRGLLRYAPSHRHGPKMLAVAGTRLGLIPHPAHELSRQVVLVEGPPDMIAGRSCGLPAIAVPGTNAWRPEWAGLLVGRRVTVVMDCDEQGRLAAERIRADLQSLGVGVDVVDLWPKRDDGYDLTDRILERRRLATRLRGSARELPGLLTSHTTLGRRAGGGHTT